MTRSASSLMRLIRPEAVRCTLKGIGAVKSADGIPVPDRAWPRGRNGFIVRLRGTDGSLWGAADFGNEPTPANVLAGCAAGDVWPVATTGTLIWRLSSDPALATRRALDAGAAEIPRGQVPEVLAYKPTQRCVLRWQRSRAPALLVKLYGGERDEQAALAYRGLRSLSAPAGVSIRILHPCSRIHRWRALVWEESVGESLHARLAAPPSEGPAAFAGVALASLHAGHADWLKSHGMEDELTGLENWIRLAGRAWPALRDTFLYALDGLWRRSASFPPGRLVPSHRDFHDKQLLLNGAEAAILDLDMACLADAELDVGNLIAHLQLRVRQRWAAPGEGAARAFLAAYRTIRPEVDPGRIDFYQSCARLRLACVYALRPRWTRLVPQLVRDACGGAANQSKETAS